MAYPILNMTIGLRCPADMGVAGSDTGFQRSGLRGRRGGAPPSPSDMSLGPTDGREPGQGNCQFYNPFSNALQWEQSFDGFTQSAKGGASSCRRPTRSSEGGGTAIRGQRRRRRPASAPHEARPAGSGVFRIASPGRQATGRPSRVGRARGVKSSES